MQEALKLIKKLAIGSSSRPAYTEAMFFLAECYGNGSLSLSVDHDKAFNLYIQASKQGHASASYRAAVCYEVGAGTKRDFARAYQFYRKAATSGDTTAMYKLGMVLLNGALGQPKNTREGVTWLKRASSQADETTPHALHELGCLYEGKFDTNGAIIPVCFFLSSPNLFAFCSDIHSRILRTHTIFSFALRDSDIQLLSINWDYRMSTDF